jgi:hypothetical protein
VGVTSTQRVNHGNGLVHFLLFVLRLLLEPTGTPTTGIMVGPTLQNELHEQLSLLYLMIKRKKKINNLLLCIFINNSIQQ